MNHLVFNEKCPVEKVLIKSSSTQLSIVQINIDRALRATQWCWRWHATTGRCIGNAASEKVSHGDVERRCRALSQVFNLRENGLRCVSPAPKRASNQARARTYAIFASQSINSAFFRFLFFLCFQLESRCLESSSCRTNLALFPLPPFFAFAPPLPLRLLFHSFLFFRFAAWRLIRSAKYSHGRERRTAITRIIN